MIPLPLAIASGGLGIAQGLFGSRKTERQRIEEDYNRRAAGMLDKAETGLNNINPQASARMAEQGVTQGMQASIATAADAAAGNMASSGDFSNPMGEAIAGATATQAAAAPFTQQIAGIRSQIPQQEMQKQDMQRQLAADKAQLSNHVSYVTQEKANPFGGILSGLVGGVNMGSNLYALMNSKNKKTTEAEGQGEEYSPGNRRIF